MKAALLPAVLLSLWPGPAPHAATPGPASIHVDTSRGPHDVLVFAARTVNSDDPAKPDPAADAPVILFVSGEGGWRSFDGLVAQDLAQAGYWVGGVDAMKYFWQAQEDRKALASDFRTMADAVVARAGRPPGWPVILAGFSFGADLAPWLAGGGGWSERVVGLLMIAPDEIGSLEFRLSEILGMQPTEHVFRVAEALRETAGIPVFFIHGAKDGSAATKELAAGAPGPKKLVVIPDADHHFSGAEERLRAALIEATAWLRDSGAGRGPMSGKDPVEPSGLLEASSPAPDSARLGLLVLARLRPLWPWLVLAALTWAGWVELKKTDVATVEGILRRTDGSLWLLLLGVTAANLAVFGLYDVVALGRLSSPPSPRARWATGVVSFAWSNFLTVGPLAGPALRLWLYRPLGVSGTRSRAALTSILAAFTVALLAWCAAAAVPLHGDGLLPRLALMPPLLLLAAVALRLLSRAKFAPPSVRAWEGNPLALAAVGVIDWLVAWSVFHLAVSGLHGSIGPAVTMRAFFLGQLVGLISFIPGGLGSADTYWLVTLGGAAGGHDRVLAALVLYRLVYYVLPWAFATLVLAGRLVPLGRRTGAFIRTAIASYAFLCGVILLVSAATPSLADRAAFLRRTIPLALVEVSHGLSVVLGFLMLVILAWTRARVPIQPPARAGLLHGRHGHDVPQGVRFRGSPALALGSGGAAHGPPSVQPRGEAPAARRVRALGGGLCGPAFRGGRLRIRAEPAGRDHGIQPVRVPGPRPALPQGADAARGAGLRARAALHPALARPR